VLAVAPVCPRLTPATRTRIKIAVRTPALAIVPGPVASVVFWTFGAPGVRPRYE
jgi:hypothetical protein